MKHFEKISINKYKDNHTGGSKDSEQVSSGFRAKCVLSSELLGIWGNR
jgi:hypothetical protein